MSKTFILIAFIVALLAVKLAHCSTTWDRILYRAQYNGSTIEDSLIKYNLILDSLKVSLRAREMLRLDLIELERKKHAIDSLQKELAK